MLTLNTLGKLYNTFSIKCLLNAVKYFKVPACHCSCWQSRPAATSVSHSHTLTHTSWNATRIWCCCFCCCWPSGEICHFLHNKIYLSSSCPLPFGGVAAVAATSAADAAAATVDVVGSRIASIVAALKTLTAHLLVVRTWLRSSFFPLQLPLPTPSAWEGGVASAPSRYV